MTATALSSTSGSERYREVVLTARSAEELQRELARYRTGHWRLAGVFNTCSTKAGGVKVTLILEQIHTLIASAGDEQAGAAVS